MPRIAGVDLPQEKRIEAALPYIYGIGRSNVGEVLRKASLDPNKRAKDLTSEEAAALTHVLEQYRTEGELRKQVRDNIERLKRTGTYRGTRHTANLPVRGQRTRTNARTKRGKRVTIGAIKKEEATKTEQKSSQEKATS